MYPFIPAKWIHLSFFLHDLKSTCRMDLDSCTYACHTWRYMTNECSPFVSRPVADLWAVRINVCKGVSLVCFLLDGFLHNEGHGLLLATWSAKSTQNSQCPLKRINRGHNWILANLCTPVNYSNIAGWITDRLKIYFLLNMGIFDCYVTLHEGILL